MGEASKAEERLNRIRRDADTPEATRRLYGEWAESYEAELTDLHGYVEPQATARALAERMIDRSAPILDVGCGTGLVGQALAERGCSWIDGIDISAEMLLEADGFAEKVRELEEKERWEVLTRESVSYLDVLGERGDLILAAVPA